MMKNPIKQIVLDILDYLRYQVENDKCTAEELRDITETFVERVGVDAMAEDAAKFYGVSENSIRQLPNYTPVPKPKRHSYFNLTKIAIFKPSKWSKKKQYETNS